MGSLFLEIGIAMSLFSVVNRRIADGVKATGVIVGVAISVLAILFG